VVRAAAIWDKDAAQLASACWQPRKYLDTCEMTSGVCGMKSGAAAETMQLTMITTCLEDIDGRLH
jgi:hypothetical protein